MSTSASEDRVRDRWVHADRLRHRVLPRRDLFAPGRILELPDCTILSGVADPAAPAAALFAPGDPRMALIHYVDTGVAHAQDPLRAASLIIGPPHVMLPPQPTGPFIAVVAPLARLTRAALAPSTMLRETALVRASRQMLLSLLEDIPQRGILEPHDIDEVLISLIRGVVRENPFVTAAGTTDAPLADRLAALIDARHGDPRLDVDSVARELHVSRRHLYRHVTGDDGIAALLAKRRVQTASDLLTRFPRLPLSEIARRSGYMGSGLLRIHFLRYVGMTPTQFRQLARAELGTE